MNTAKKIGLAVVIITEVMFALILIMGLLKVYQDKAKFEDLISLGYAQTGVLIAVWGSQAGVNYAKNRGPKQIFNSVRGGEGEA